MHQVHAQPPGVGVFAWVTFSFYSGPPFFGDACCIGRSRQACHDVHTQQYRDSTPRRQQPWTAGPTTLARLANDAQARTIIIIIDSLPAEWGTMTISRQLTIQGPGRCQVTCTSARAQVHLPQREHLDTPRSDTISCTSWERKLLVRAFPPSYQVYH